MTRNQIISWSEVALFYGLAQFVIWAGGKWRPSALLIAVMLLIICVASNKFHRDTAQRIGLTLENFWPAMRLLLPWALPVLAALLIYGWSKRYAMEWNLWFVFLGYPIWGFAQEYTLLGFVANRLEDGLPEKQGLVPWLNGFLFSLAHLPNPVLMLATFISGVLFTSVFFRRRNLLAPALIHALVGVAISLAFADIHGIMSVGPGYSRRLGTLP